MNETERRKQNAWLHEALGNCAHREIEQWSIEDGNDYEWGFRCKKCGEDPHSPAQRVPDYYGKDWPALAEAMRQRGCWVKIILRPDSHKSAHKYYCEIEHRGDEWAYHANADTPSEAVCAATELALGAEQEARRV